MISFPIFGENFSLNPSDSFNVLGKDIYWYGVIIALGFLLAVVYGFRRSKDFGLTQDNIIDVLLFAVPTGIICARLYYVIFNFSLFSAHPIDIFKIWEGGLAIYGGIIGSVIVAAIYCKVKKISIGAMLDIGGFGFLIGQAVGRWGNFFNREAFGGETNVPWRMGLTLDGVTKYVHPTFLYESLWNILGFLLLHIYSKRRRKYDGQIFLLYIAWYGLGRFLIEGMRSDSLYLFHTEIRVSQFLAALSFSAAIIILLRNYLRNKHRPENLFVNRITERKESEITESVTGKSDSENVLEFTSIEPTNETKKEAINNQDDDLNKGEK